MPTKMPRLNNHGYPYLPIPEEFLADLVKLENPNFLNSSMSYDQFRSTCEEYESLYGWVESYHFEQYGPAPIDEEFDPEHVSGLFERLDRIAERIYAVEKAPHLINEVLTRSTPNGASNENWALYAMATDPVSIGSIDGNCQGYPVLLRQLALAGDKETSLLVYAPTWFPGWLHDEYVRHPYVHIGASQPSPEELELHIGALRLWAPYTRDHVFHDYHTAYNAAKKTWQRISVPI
jgi:hypothetical protein